MTSVLPRGREVCAYSTSDLPGKEGGHDPYSRKVDRLRYWHRDHMNVILRELLIAALKYEMVIIMNSSQYVQVRKSIYNESTSRRQVTVSPNLTVLPRTALPLPGRHLQASRGFDIFLVPFCKISCIRSHRRQVLMLIVLVRGLSFMADEAGQGNVFRNMLQLSIGRVRVI